MSAQDFLYLELEQARLFVVREPYAHALGSVASGTCWRDPCDLAGNRVTLCVFRQRQQHINVSSQLIFTAGGNEDSAFLEHWNVSCVKGGFFLNRQLHNAWPSSGCRRVTG